MSAAGPTTFSRRTGWDRRPNALARALAARPAPPALDLTQNNPTRVGFPTAPELAAALAEGARAPYEPSAAGLLDARRAVAEYYGLRGATCDPEHVWLAASTSELYLQVLAVAADPGDAVAIPRPGYPLIDWVADLLGLRLVPYPLAYDGGWHVDLGRLREIVAAEPGLRAIVCVAPGNPSGNYLHRSEVETLEELCAARGLALVIDEVFADFPLRDDPTRVPHLVGLRHVATFVLSGLSKVAALPHFKLAWGVAAGPAEARAEAIERILLVSDAFLSAGSPAQRALPAVLAAAPGIQTAILGRIRPALARLRTRLAGAPIEVLDVEGGWAAVLRLPSVDGLDDVDWTLRALERDVLVQPGSLFELDGTHVVVSLLTPPTVFERGIDGLTRVVSDVLAREA
jgi:hypothetical protein